MDVSRENQRIQNGYDEIHGSTVVRLVVTTILVALIVYFTWQRRKFVSKINKLPSYKWNFYHIFGDAQHAFRIRRMKTHLSHSIYDLEIFNAYSIIFQNESFFSVWAALWPVIIVHKADAAEAVLNNSTNLKKAWMYKFTEPWLGNGLLLSYDTKWKNRRKLLTPAFHFNILKNFLHIMNKQSKIFVDILNHHTLEKCIDISPFAKRCTLDIVCESILGVEIGAQTEQSSSYAKSVSILSSALSERIFNPLLWSHFIFKMSPGGRRFYKNLKIVHDFTDNLIRERKKLLLESKTSRNSEDEDISTPKRKAFLDLLLDEHVQNNSISEEEIREEVDTFTFGGHDTSSSAISWSMYLIGLHPGIQEKVRQELDSIFGDSDRDVTMDDLREMKYLECVLKECLRLYPPIGFFGREIEHDMEFQGRIIPKGCHVSLTTYILHRDSNVFPNPEKFDPDRFSPENSIGRSPFAYIPFSAGPRNCIGQRFAFMELKTVISSVFRKFKVRSLDPRDKIHLVTEIGLKPVESLRLEIRSRNHQTDEASTYFYNS